MEWLFGKKMTPDEMLRKNKRALDKAMRELDREKAKMEQQEKKIIMEIKKNAKAGQMDAVKVMAKVRASLFLSVCIDMSAMLVLLLLAGLGQDTAPVQEVHDHEGKHPGCLVENTDTQIPELHGHGD